MMVSWSFNTLVYTVAESMALVFADWPCHKPVAPVPTPPAANTAMITGIQDLSMVNLRDLSGVSRLIYYPSIDLPNAPIKNPIPAPKPDSQIFRVRRVSSLTVISAICLISMLFCSC